MPKVTIDGKTVEFESGKLPYQEHGKPESILDVCRDGAAKRRVHVAESVLDRYDEPKGDTGCNRGRRLDRHDELVGHKERF